MAEPAASSAADWRVPQDFTSATSYEVREVVQDYVVRDLLGPWAGATETLTSEVRGMPRDPRDRYLVGMLGPKKSDATEQTDAESTDLDLGATVSHETDLPEQVNPRTLGSLWVSSMGMSFQVGAGDDAPRRVVVDIKAGRYAADHEQLDDGGKISHPTAREPLHWSVEVDLDLADQRIGLEPPGPTSGGPAAGSRTVRALADPDGITLRCQVRVGAGKRVVRVMLVNDQPASSTPKYRSWIFQSSLSVTALDGAAPIFVASGADAAPHGDAEEAHLELLYQHTPSFATGHNVAVRVDRRDGELAAWRVSTDWVPVTDVPQVTAPPLPDVEISMSRLADLAAAADPEALVSRLRPLVTAYQGWIDTQVTAAGALEAVWSPVAHRAIEQATIIAARLQGAIDLLEQDPQARQAFAFANRAMRLQRHNTVAAGLRERDPQLSYAEALAQVRAEDGDVENSSWRPFQLAFVLLNLPSLTRPDHPERTDHVDLLFFPTGGGKTEAYLGLAAFTFAIRRLQGVIGVGQTARDGRGGVAVLMRYTLRLLTAQQFQRAAALVCAAEMLRHDDPDTWGAERFSIGLWVGMSVSPNWYADAATSIANARESGRRGVKVPVLQTALCPWCAEPMLAERDLHPDDVTRRVVLWCPRGEGAVSASGEGACPFSRRHNPDGLPIMTVDEEVYREPPTLLIATVDKLAQLPWYGFAGLLFGRVAQRCPRHGYRHPDLDTRIGCGARHTAAGAYPGVASEPATRLRPPDLIIQDELHLISGALGSTVGLFETAVDELTSWVTPSGVRTSPKIIASTATTKRAAEQVRALFARGLAIFPPQVLDARSTFFSTEVPITADAPGRRYLGLCAHGTRLKAAEIRLAEILLLAGQTVLDAYGPAADPYASIVGYFNSTRELAGMRRYLDDQVLTRVSRTPWRSGMAARTGRDLKITELTSRISSAYITDALHQLTVPFDPETRTTARTAAINAAIKELAGRRPDDLVDERPTDVALATSMLQVGVDVARLGLMVITGQPKNVAEYIQASSRVGRVASKPGLVVTLFNWTRPRDLAYYEDFQHSHATMYRRVEALSVTPFARRCLDRGTAGVVVAALRNSSDAWSTDIAAQDVDLTSAEVGQVIERMAERAKNASNSLGRDYLVEKVNAFVDRWRGEQDRADAPVAYRKTRRKLVQYVPLIRPAGEGRWTEMTVARSMRETENDISLLLPVSPRIFDPIYDAPPWAVKSTEAAPTESSPTAPGGAG